MENKIKDIKDIISEILEEEFNFEDWFEEQYNYIYNK